MGWDTEYAYDTYGRLFHRTEDGYERAVQSWKEWERRRADRHTDGDGPRQDGSGQNDDG